MAKQVYADVVDFRMIDNGKVVEDVTSVTPPNVTHPTSDFNSAGMAGTVQMPNQYKVEAMEFVVNHNNGTNHAILTAGGTHVMEFRLARQKYTVNTSKVDPEGVKYRVTGFHKATEESQIEASNPLATTERYSLVKYEKIVNGVSETLIDITSGKIRKNGVDQTSAIEALLK